MPEFAPPHWLSAWNPRRSLRARFALMLGASGLVFALLAAFVVDRLQRAQLLDSQGQAMRREALLLSRSLNLTLQDRLQQLRDLAAQPLMSSPLAEPGEVRLLLENLRTAQPALAWLAVLDRQGRVLVATNTLLEGSDLSAEPWFAPAAAGPWIGARRPAGALSEHLGLAGGEAPALIDLGLPLLDGQGRTWGVLTARLRWDWLDAIHRAMQAPGRRLPGSDSLVLDRFDQVLIGPADRLGQPLPATGIDTLRSASAPGLVDWPGEGRFVTAVGRDGTDDGGGSAGLSVVARQPEAQAFAAADAVRQRLLAIGLLATLAFVAISVWIATRVSRPIRALAAEAGRVVRDEAPDFGSLAPRRDDEVADLARQLQRLHAELDRRLVEQRRASERYQALFDSAPEAIYFTDGQTLQLANAACLQLFRAADLAQLQGRTSMALFHPDDRPLLAQRQQLMRAWKPSDPVPPMLAHRVLRLDGSVARVESTALPLDLGALQGVQVVLRDVTDEHRARTLLAEREAQLNQTSHMARVGGWQYDLRTQASTWTDEMARICEVPPDTRPSRRLALAYFQGEDRARLEQAVERALRDGEPYDLELQLTTASGRRKWVRAQGRRVLEDGQPVRLEGITQDITERRAAQEALQALNAELERRVVERTAELQAANAELDSFAYAVSHDLRAPLRAMSGFAQALVEDHGGQLDAEARSYLDEIVHGSARMGELIDGLLALSRSLRGALRADDVDLSALALQCLQELQRAEPQRRVTLRIVPGLHASGDRRMLDAVLHNLLGNAWKYSTGTPEACISFGSEQVDGQTWFVVQDNGAGFDMAHAGRLFKAFARLHRQDEFPGLGIGLATVQRIIQRHGGRIVAEAVPGRGATFRFTLPARRSDPLLETGST